MDIVASGSQRSVSLRLPESTHMVLSFRDLRLLLKLQSCMKELQAQLDSQVRPESEPEQVRISDCAQSNVHTNLKSGPLDPCWVQ